MTLALALLVTVLLPKTLALDKSQTLTAGETPKPNRGYFSSSKMIDSRPVFSPRMDYDEWTPLGRGDPLKNDPTYDYVPPVLERVHYWMDPSKRTPDPPLPNSGVLILGSSRTEPTVMSRTTPKYQTVHTNEPQADSRIDTMSLLDPLLKLMDVSQLSLNLPSTTNYYRPTISPNRIQQTYPRPIHSSNKPRVPPQALQRPPYTMLMPPPPPLPTSSPPQLFATSTTSRTEPVEVQTQFATLSPFSSPSSVTTTKPEDADTNITTIYPTAFTNTENVYKPVAISMPEEVKDSHLPRPGEDSMILPIVTMFNNHKKIQEQDEHNQDVDELKNNPDPDKHGHINHLHHHQYPSGENGVNYSFRPEANDRFNNKETGNLQDNTIKEPSDTMTPPNKGAAFFSKTKPLRKHEDGFRSTTLRPLTTTRAAATLTTDSMFKHYKQPSEPVKGPFYLIIQGHSKVKTYGASKNPINGFVSSNEIKDDDDDRKSTSQNEYYDLETQAENEKRRGKKLDNFEYGAGDENIEIVETPPNSETSRSIKSQEESEGFHHMENLEDTFGKSSGGNSKKRYLVNDLKMIERRRKRYIYDDVVNKIRKLLSKEIVEVSPILEFSEGSETSEITEVVEETSTNLQGLSASELESLATIATSTQLTSTTPVHKLQSQTVKNSTKPDKDVQENLNLESLIALSEDYNGEDIINNLLKQEGQGSGFGNFVSSIFGRSAKENEEDM